MGPASQPASQPVSQEASFFFCDIDQCQGRRASADPGQTKDPPSPLTLPFETPSLVSAGLDQFDLHSRKLWEVHAKQLNMSR